MNYYSRLRGMRTYHACLQYFYFRGSSRIRHIAVELGNGWIQMLWVWHICQTHVTLHLAGCQAQGLWVWHVCQTYIILSFGRSLPSPSSLGSGMFSRPTLSWTCLTVKSKFFRVWHIFILALPLGWLTTKPKSYTSDMFVTCATLSLADCQVQAL
jgi:hypothetical protein